MKSNQTKKEQNTSRRKRTRGALKKAFELWERCDLDVAFFVRNPDDNQLHAFLSKIQSSWPPSIDDIRACPTARLLLPEDFEELTQRTNVRASPGSTYTKGGRKVIGGDRGKTSSKTTSIFPDPPTFDLTFQSERTVKQERGLILTQSDKAEITPEMLNARSTTKFGFTRFDATV